MPRNGRVTAFSVSSYTLLSSELTVWNNSFMFLCEKKMSISFANFIGSNILDTLHKSFTYVMNRCVYKIDSLGHHN